MALRLRKLLSACTLCALLLGGLVGAGEAGAAAKAKTKTAPKITVKCHWVKATKKRKRHRVCVKAKAKTKTIKKTTTTTTTTTTTSGKAPAVVTPAAPATSPAVPATPAATPAAAAAPAAAVAPPSSGFAPVVTAPVAARLQATTRDQNGLTLSLSRPAIAAGALILQLVNQGEDGHNLHLRPAAGGADVLAIAETDPGSFADGNATLAAGTYTLYCALPGHEQAGMKATLTVN
jgi:plastocyanin